MIHHFSGRSILVAEDDYYLAMDVKAALLAIGVRPLGPAPDPEKALLFIGATDIAVIDVELRDGTNGCTIADALDHQGTPFRHGLCRPNPLATSRPPHLPQASQRSWSAGRPNRCPSGPFLIIARPYGAGYGVGKPASQRSFDHDWLAVCTITCIAVPGHGNRGPNR